MMRDAWMGYKTYAWGMDELNPVYSAANWESWEA